MCSSDLEKLFSEKDREEIDKLHLSFIDFMKVVEASMDLVIGEESRGEQ